MQSLLSHWQLHKKLLQSLQVALRMRQMLSRSHRLAGTSAGAASPCLSSQACRTEQDVVMVQLLQYICLQAIKANLSTEAACIRGMVFDTMVHAFCLLNIFRLKPLSHKG